MIRVTHVIWRAHLGGIERLVHDLVAAQRLDEDLGVSVLFGTAVGDFMPAFQATGASLDSADFDTGYDLAPRKLHRASRMLASADVIHVHTFVLPLALSAVATRRPIVFTEHGNFSFGRKLRWSDYAKRPLSRAFMKHAVAHVTFNSEYTGRVWRQRYPGWRSPCSVVENGILVGGSDEQGVAPAEDLTTWAGDSVIVGTSSRFATFKRIDRLIDAFARCALHRDAKLLLVGDGPLYRDIERRVSRLGLTERTLMTGFRSDVRACQSVMDVCVFASTAESFGLACVETLALGKPTIVLHDGGGLTDIVRPLCADDVVESIAGLADRILYYCDHPEARTRPSEERRAYARRYDIKNTAAGFKKVYIALLKK